jgi:GTP-binding protein HflX
VFTLADTVGFVRHLPHQLVEAFRSTLEEVTDADLILHVVDGSDDLPEGQIAAVREVLAEIGAAQVPELLVVNKSDLADPLVVARLMAREPHSVVVSAASGQGIGALLEAVEVDLPNPPEHVEVLVPFDRGDLVARVHEEGRDVRVDYTADGARVTAVVGVQLAAELSGAAIAPAEAPAGDGPAPADTVPR